MSFHSEKTPPGGPETLKTTRHEASGKGRVGRYRRKSMGAIRLHLKSISKCKGFKSKKTS
jgi:hypothetical protein